MSSFHERKEQRKRYYNAFVYGWKQRRCSACYGSGYYDDKGSPKCSSCDGTRKERYKPEKVGKVSCLEDEC